MTATDLDRRLTAVALIEAHRRRDRAAVAALLNGIDDANQLRTLADALAGVAGTALRLYAAEDAQAFLDTARRKALDADVQDASP